MVFWVGLGFVVGLVGEKERKSPPPSSSSSSCKTLNSQLYPTLSKYKNYKPIFSPRKTNSVFFWGGGGVLGSLTPKKKKKEFFAYAGGEGGEKEKEKEERKGGRERRRRRGGEERRGGGGKGDGGAGGKGKRGGTGEEGGSRGKRERVCCTIQHSKPRSRGGKGILPIHAPPYPPPHKDVAMFSKQGWDFSHQQSIALAPRLRSCFLAFGRRRAAVFGGRRVLGSSAGLCGRERTSFPFVLYTLSSPAQKRKKRKKREISTSKK